MAKIIGIDNSVWGEPMLIKADDLGNLSFELLSRIVRFDSDRTTTASSMSDTTTINT